MVKIIKPSIGGHDGSSFRELLDMWSERGFCTIEQGPNKRSQDHKDDPDSPEAKCWVEEQGNILLYDFPILDRLKNEYKQCLFSNTYKEGEGNKKWIFWPKYSRLYDKSKYLLLSLIELHISIECSKTLLFISRFSRLPLLISPTSFSNRFLKNRFYQ